MANVITQFLVGLGISYDGKGADDIGRDLDELTDRARDASDSMDEVGDNLGESVRRGSESAKSRIMSLVTTFKAAGLAMSGVAAGVGAAWAFESKKAQQAYDLNNQLVTSQFGPTEVYGLGALAEQRGGDRQATTNSLLNIERGINRIQTGDAGMIQQLAVAGIRVDNPTGRTREDIYSDIAGQFQRLDTTRQSNVAEVLGLDPATVRVWQEFGATTLEVSKARAAELGYTEQHNAALNAINQTILDTQQKMEGLGNTIADILAPSIKTLADDLLTLASGVTNWMNNHRDLIDDISSGSWYDKYVVGSADKAATWIGDKTGFDPRNVGKNTQNFLNTTGATVNNSIVNNTTNTEQLPPWAWQPQRENSSPVNDGSYGAEVSPVTDNYAQQSQQMNHIMESINRPIQLNGNFTTQGDVILDGNAIGRYTVNHLETQVYPQAIDQTRQRSY
ncbi:putative tape measure protein [Klebsiella phage vB_KpnM_KpV79]|uniref:Putative tape measure protein n=1 Tax=Klebsiella phage vB_KpnM_KpV79 TaxID=2041212 RepID=A0A291LCJ7_9CAUD|nr:tail length tape measure protein [Klebsiella phage vB_KpnM_KpV79]ATI16489.1 putative tape measure protein [Klebsiella phage vB_KpnM_KpV79]